MMQITESFKKKGDCEEKKNNSTSLFGISDLRTRFSCETTWPTAVDLVPFPCTPTVHRPPHVQAWWAWPVFWTTPTGPWGPCFFRAKREEGWSPTSILNEADVSAKPALQEASGLDHTQVRQLALGVGVLTIKVNIQKI